MTTETTGKDVPAKIQPRGIYDLREEIDRLWETMLASPWRPFLPGTKQRPVPAMDVFEKDGQLHIRAELPGLTDKDIQVEVTNDAITISGEKGRARSQGRKLLQVRAHLWKLPKASGASCGG